MRIIFIPGKNVSTKSIKDNNITAHFEVPSDFDPKEFINKPLKLFLDDGVEMDATLSQEGASYYYNASHGTYVIKLDIILPDILAMGLVFKSEELHLAAYKEGLQ